MSVADEITRIKNAKENLKTSINAKLSDNQAKITDELINQYSQFVDNIQGGVDINDYFITEGLTSSKYVLRDLIKKCPVIDMTGITNVNAMFSNCKSLMGIPLLDTSEVTSMSSMFSGCPSLIEIPLLNTSKVTNMSNMFYNCVKLKTIPSFDLSSITHCINTFQSCSALETVPEFNCPNVINVNNMFQGCGSLTEQSLNNILGTCITMTKISSSEKTLKNIGLTSSQATTCQGLSNYQAFLDADWTTGY